MTNSPAILLATFNGEKFIVPMLNSIVGQIDVQPTVYWRDDGSSDATARIVRRYHRVIDIREVPSHGRLGPCASFLALLRESAPRHTSVHFADQDDIWEPRKVAHAHQVVLQNETPTLLHCRQQLIDSTDRPLRLSRIPAAGSFNNSMCENIAVGCTVALNHTAARLVAKGSPNHALMHDWWAYLVVSAVGRIAYDHHPWIQYRQHSQNVVGGNLGFVLRSRRRLKRVATRSGEGGPFSGQLLDLLNIHGDLLTYEQRSRIERLLAGTTSISQRLKNCIMPPATRQGFIDQLLLRGLLLANRF